MRGRAGFHVLVSYFSVTQHAEETHRGSKKRHRGKHKSLIVCIPNRFLKSSCTLKGRAGRDISFFLSFFFSFK